MPEKELITNVDDFQRRYLNSDRTRYPVRLDIQVTQEEATFILNWIRDRRVYDYVHRSGTGAH